MSSDLRWESVGLQSPTVLGVVSAAVGYSDSPFFLLKLASCTVINDDGKAKKG